jgi:hypothetical protein
MMLLLLALPTIALVGGPPMLSVERLDSTAPELAKGFALGVTATQCGAACTAPVTARLEGLVDGGRTSRTLMVVPVAGSSGRWLVKRDWPAQACWAVVVESTSHGEAAVILRVDEASKAAPQLVHRAITPKEIDAVLRDDARLEI